MRQQEGTEKQDHTHWDKCRMDCQDQACCRSNALAALKA